MKHLLIILAAVLFAGCCTTPTFTDATTTVVNSNAEAWDRVHTLAALTLPEAGEIDGKTRSGWLAYIVSAEANAILLQAKADGRKLTYAEALAKAEELTLP